MSLKNLLRCSENKQRKEKTQTMKKNFILLLLDLFQLNYLLRNLNASSSLCKTTVVLFSLLFLNFLLFCIISKISMSFLLKTSSDFPELFDCLNDNTAIEAKRVEKLNLTNAMSQSKADAKDGEFPVVIHRKSNEKSLVIMELKDWIELYRAYEMDKEPETEINHRIYKMFCEGCIS